MIKQLIGSVILLCTITGCGNRSTAWQLPEILPSKTISIKNSDISDKEIDGMLKLTSYITLSNKIPLGEVKRIIIDRDRIYILDNEPKIACFDMQGRLLFKIDNRGRGPMEYDKIADFAVNRISGQLVAFDNYKMKLFLYDAANGLYQSDVSILNRLAPTEFGMVGDAFFYKNIDHHRFDIQKKQMFYLLYSQDGTQADQMFLPHDAVAEYGFDLKSFFYNEDRLLFVKPFDNMVYQLLPGGMHPLYEIQLPNPLPMKKIKEKMKHWELVNSAYSYGLSDIYLTGNILYFTFSKDGWLIRVFFDVSTDQFLYCGKPLLLKSQKDLPFIYLMNGVYDGKFFSFIPADALSYYRENTPEFFPEDLLEMKDEDNGVIAFYSFDLKGKT